MSSAFSAVFLFGMKKSIVMSANHPKLMVFDYNTQPFVQEENTSSCAIKPFRKGRIHGNVADRFNQRPRATSQPLLPSRVAFL